MYDGDYELPKDYWAGFDIDFKFTACNEYHLNEQIENFKNYINKYDEGVSINDITIEEN